MSPCGQTQMSGARNSALITHQSRGRYPSYTTRVNRGRHVIFWTDQPVLMIVLVGVWSR
jgi:hypothetical protein